MVILNNTTKTISVTTVAIFSEKNIVELTLFVVQVNSELLCD